MPLCSFNLVVTQDCELYKTAANKMQCLLQGSTALHAAATNVQMDYAAKGGSLPPEWWGQGCDETVEALVLHGADVNAENVKVCLSCLVLRRSGYRSEQLGLHCRRVFCPNYDANRAGVKLRAP